MPCAVVAHPSLSVHLDNLRADSLGISASVSTDFVLSKLNAHRSNQRLLLLLNPKRSVSFYESWSSSESAYVVAVAVSSSEASEFGLCVKDPFECFGLDIPPQPPVDLIAETVAVHVKDSFLQQFQTSLYRIPKEDRPRARARILSYLSGALKRPPPTGVRRLDEILSSDVCLRLRNAIQHAKRHGVEAAAVVYNIDPFDIRYILANIGLEPK